MAEPQHSNAPNEKNPLSEQKSTPKRENMFLNLGCNLLLPIMILNKGEKWMGGLLEAYFQNVAVAILIAAISFPIGYFIYDLITRSKCNLISIVGLISVLLTGLFGVLQLPVEWFPLKEAALPLVIGIGVFVSNYTKNNFCKAVILNPDICEVERIEAKLESENCRPDFERLLRKCNWLIILSFAISAIVNFLLAKWIVVSPTGTPEFNAEVSKMMWVTVFAMLVPSMGLMMLAFWKLLKGIKQMTGLDLEDVLHGAEAKEKAPAEDS